MRSARLCCTARFDYALLPAQTLATDIRRSDAYLAPEVIVGRRADARSDLYALAATLYHLLVGIPPVDATTRQDLVRQGALDPLEPLHHASADVPALVGAVLQAALALDPSAPTGSRAISNVPTRCSGRARTQLADQSAPAMVVAALARRLALEAPEHTSHA